MLDDGRRKWFVRHVVTAVVGRALSFHFGPTSRFRQVSKANRLPILFGEQIDDASIAHFLGGLRSIGFLLGFDFPRRFVLAFAGCDWSRFSLVDDDLQAT